MNYILSIILIFLSQCAITPSAFLSDDDAIARPYNGHNRNTLFSNYLSVRNSFSSARSSAKVATYPFYETQKKRTEWLPKGKKFRTAYQKFQIDLLLVNQFSYPNSFTWLERIMIADAFDLVVMAINSPVFETEMKKLSFTQNDSDTALDPEDVIKDIQNSSFSVLISKNNLDDGVAAEATIGGISHTIWFRNDRDYANYNVVELAVIIAHELTHNLGYKHSSNVPYGIHRPVLEAIHKATQEDMNIFTANTPYFEEAFLQRVRIHSSTIQHQGYRELKIKDDNNLEIDIKKIIDIVQQ